ncbi:MAG: phenylalanine--tRNA ligase subunit beta [Alphaproteobacteria bacterium]|nr:phenylalanine--tRNA ligase subunit beta [Alphaproteobacteria bacterium]
MKLTVNWLKDHLDTTASVQEIVEALTQIGLEVEHVDNPAERLKGFVVGMVVEAIPHPNADRLRLCQVDDGTGPLVQVVCGASNVRQGMKVAFARVGTMIPVTGQPLKKGTIRNVDSFGMLCSAEELLLDEKSEGIIDLKTNLAPGSDLAQALDGLDDVVIELSITPNRSDCFSVRGVARDLAAYGLGTLKDLTVPKIIVQNPCPISVQITDPNCLYFTGRIIEGVQNAQSPEWVQRRLASVGQRSLSALIDVTNYICLDLGRPMHVYDADKIQGGLVVRSAKAGEVLDALNGEPYQLQDGMTVIADESGPLSLGGIMGGVATSCTPKTTRVFLESAYFDPIQTAKTGRALRILSESRTRFERGVDPADVQLGLEIATQWILDWCGGAPSLAQEAGDAFLSKKTISLSLEKLRGISGDQSLTLIDAAPILQRLGFSVLGQTDQQITVDVPSWRHDITLDVDVVEEIVRLRGYDKIQATSLPLKRPPLDNDQSYILKQTLCHRGLQEIYTWSLIDQETAQKFGDSIELEMPLNQEMAVLRPSLLPGHLKAIAANQNKSQVNGAFFELARQFKPTSTDFAEEAMLSGVRSLQTGPRHWAQNPRPVDVYDAKADVVAILDLVGISSYQVVDSAPDYYHPGRKGAIKQGQRTLAYFGEIHPTLVKEFEIAGPVVAFEVFINTLPKEIKRKLTPPTLSPYQPVTRDFAFIVDRGMSADQMIRTIQKIDKTLIQDIVIFDVYSGDKLPDGKKSIAFQVRLQASDRTLSDTDLQVLSDSVVREIGRACGGVLRD